MALFFFCVFMDLKKIVNNLFFKFVVLVKVFRFLHSHWFSILYLYANFYILLELENGLREVETLFVLSLIFITKFLQINIISCMIPSPTDYLGLSLGLFTGKTGRNKSQFLKRNTFEISATKKASVTKESFCVYLYWMLCKFKALYIHWYFAFD